MRQFMTAALASGFLASACGGDPFSGLQDEDDFGPERSDVGAESGATQAVQGAVGMGGLVDASEVDESAVGAVGQLSAAALPIVSDAFFDEAELRSPQTRAVATSASRIGDARWAEFPECVEQDGDVLRFRDCEVAAGNATTTMDGVIEIEGDRLVADLDIDATVDFDDMTQESSTQLFVDLLLDETRIEGRVESDTSATIPGAGSARQTSVLIYDIELEGGCATGGELRAGVEQRASGGGHSQTLRAIGRAVFGPECGDVSVYARLD